MLSIPSYIARAAVHRAPIVHAWNNDDPASLYLVENRPLQSSLSRMSDRALTALSLGMAEWVAWRLDPSCSTPMLFQVIEAGWAALVDWKLVHLDRLPTHPYHKSHPEWLGPVRGPMRGAAGMLREILDLTRRGQFPWPEAACLSQLAIYVLADRKPFLQWRRNRTRRLAQWYPRDLQNVLGPPLPRQAVDPSSGFAPESADEMIAAFVSSLDPASNPYLAPKS